MENYKFKRNQGRDKLKAIFGVLLFLLAIGAYAAHDQGLIFNDGQQEQIMEDTKKPRA